MRCSVICDAQLVNLKYSLDLHVLQYKKKNIEHLQYNIDLMQLFVLYKHIS